MPPRTYVGKLVSWSETGVPSSFAELEGRCEEPPEIPVQGGAFLCDIRTSALLAGVAMVPAPGHAVVTAVRWHRGLSIRQKASAIAVALKAARCTAVLLGCRLVVATHSPSLRRYLARRGFARRPDGTMRAPDRLHADIPTKRGGY